jgi:hypothetical protein
VSKNKLYIIGTVVLFLGIALLIQFISPNIADPDGLYHITHAKIYLENGIFYNEFPWVQFSVIKDLKADLWYGFHLFLIPFNFFTNRIFGVKLAGSIIAFFTLLMFFWAIKRLKIKYSAMWILMFIVSAPDILYRLTMTRPHNLSLGLAMLTLSFGLSGGIWAIFLISAASAFLHIALAWLPILIIFVISAVRKTQKLTIEWKKIFAVFGGAILGLLLRPNPLGALKLFYIQVIKLSVVHMKGIPLLFGRELKPSEPMGFLRQILPVLFIALILAFVFTKIRKKIPAEIRQIWKIKVYSALSLTVIFTLIAQLMMRRSYDLMNGFGIFTIALIVSTYFIYLESQKKIGQDYIAKTKNRILIAGFIIICIFCVNSVPLAYSYMKQAWSPTYLKEVSQWLKENTKPGDIVFNSRWDYFGGLFFWNQQNYYINGMDPIFAYAKNESLYWESHFIASDIGYENTCEKIRCIKEEIVHTNESFLNHFNSSYIVLRLIQNPKTYSYWLGDKNYELVFDNKKEAIFKILPIVK